MSEDSSVIGQLIYTARLARTAREEFLSKHGLYSGQDLLLKSLDEDDGQTMGSLAGRLGVKPPTVTKMVTRMSSQNLVRRKASRVDSRQSHVYITDEGRDLIQKVNKAWKRVNKTALKGLKDKERKRLTKLLVKLRDNLADSTQDSASSQKIDLSKLLD